MADLRNKALGFLSRREHSRSELQQKLSARAADEAALALIEPLLDDFEARGWLSDRRFAEQWVSSRSSRFGANRLRAELRQKGVANELIDAALDETHDDEFTCAQAVWRKKYPHPPADANERGKQLRYLAGRGFSLNVIYRVVGGEEPEMD